MSDCTNGPIRFRLYLGGTLAEEHWVTTPEQASDLSDRHQARTAAADAEDVLWMVETFCPGCPPDSAYFRFGTDTNGMGPPD